MPTTTFDIFRYQPDVSDEAYRQTFELEHEGDITLLDAILRHGAMVAAAEAAKG